MSIGYLDSLLPRLPAQVAWIARKGHKGIASRRLFRESQSGGERARPSTCPRPLATKRAIEDGHTFRAHPIQLHSLHLNQSNFSSLPSRPTPPPSSSHLTAQTKLPVDLPLPFCCCCCSCCVPGIANAASSSSSSSSSSSRLPPPASGLCGSRVDVDLAGGGGGAAPAPPEAADEACHAGEE